jgi:hypothetical protein
MSATATSGLRLAGSSRAQALGMLAVEAVLVAAALAVAATLLPGWRALRPPPAAAAAVPD